MLVGPPVARLGSYFVGLEAVSIGRALFAIGHLRGGLQKVGSRIAPLTLPIRGQLFASQALSEIQCDVKNSRTLVIIVQLKATYSDLELD